MQKLLMELSVSAVLFFLCSLMAHAETNSSLVNERFTVSRPLLEKHWHIDCDSAVSSTLDWLSSQQGKEIKDWDKLAWRDLKYCGLLFNTSATDRYQPCPEYSQAYHRLSEVMGGKSTLDVNVQTITHLLSTQCE
jgi:hypothetical protein